jgi:hypothetical protein
MLLVLAISITGGCTGGGDAAGDHAEVLAKRYGLERSEYIALKKANRDPKKFAQAIQERRIKDMKEQGVVVKTLRSPNKTTRPH